MNIGTQLRGPWPGRKDPLDGVRVVKRTLEFKPPHNKLKSKYDDVFDKLKVGMALQCKPENRKVLANALNKWLKLRGMGDKLRATYTLEEGLGYVYLIEREVPTVQS